MKVCLSCGTRSQ